MNSQYLNLLNLFIANDSLTIEELMASEHVSERTMMKYIHQLNDDLKGIACVVEKQHHFYLKVDDFQKLAKIQTSHLKQSLDFNDADKRQAFILKRLFESKSFVTLDDLSEELTISKTTINRDLKGLRGKLKDYKVKVDSMTNNGIKLSVSEDFEAPIVVVKLLYDYFNLRQLMNTGRLKQYQMICNDLGIEKELEREIFRNLVALKFVKQNGYKVMEPIKHFKKMWLNEGVLTPLIKFCKEFFNNNVSEAEFNYLLSPLSFRSNQLLSNQLVSDQLEKNKQIFMKIKDQSNVNSIDFDHVYEQIKYHFTFLINRAIFHSFSSQILPSNLLDKYPVAYDLAQSTISQLSSFLGTNINFSEAGYLILYFEMEIEDKGDSDETYANIAIVGQVGASVKKFIEYQLNDIFDNEVKLDTFKDPDELNRSSRQFLLIFSEIPIRYSDPIVPIIRISSAFKDLELKIRVQVSLVEKAIKNLQVEFNFWELDQKKGYLKSVEKIINQKIDEGSLTKQFLSDWLKREERGVGVFGNEIVVPHIVDASGNQRILLQVGVFNQTVKYQGQSVRMIFLIGIPKELDYELSRVLSQIYDFVFLVINNNNLYQRLLNFDSAHSLAQITEGL